MKENHLFHPPFFVILDPDSNSIVISVRGTLSTADVLVDLNCNLKEIFLADASGILHTAHTHGGMLRSAENIKSELESLDILKNAMQKFPEYQIRSVGHSLGAGVAALLAHLLRQQGLSATCFAYGPPGCISTSESKTYF